FFTAPPPPTSTLFPYTTLFRSQNLVSAEGAPAGAGAAPTAGVEIDFLTASIMACPMPRQRRAPRPFPRRLRLHSRPRWGWLAPPDRKSTRLNSSHVSISYAVFC